MLVLGLVLFLTITSIKSDLKTGFAKVMAEYESFRTSLEHFQTSYDVCEDGDAYEEVKMSVDKFLATRQDHCKNSRIHEDCAGIKEEIPDAKDGIYRIKPRDEQSSFLVYCDMTNQGGGWLVIQRREDGSEDFYRTWFEYMDGFGNITGEFWLGNEKLHQLTSQKQYKLRIDLEDKDGNTKFAEYNMFRVANMSEFYKLNIDGFSGNADNYLQYHNNARFSAMNLDLDTHQSTNCAQARHGAWWFKDCANVHLNGLYTGSGKNGVYWHPNTYSKSVMKIRPVQ